MSEDDVVVEATGETVGEAKWAALRELELRHPGVDKSAVHFEVISEGERGLLGVGYEPARVLAKAPAESLDASALDESPLAAESRALVSRVTNALGVDGRLAGHRLDAAKEDRLRAALAGPAERPVEAERNTRPIAASSSG